MKINSVSISGFLSFGKTQKIDLSSNGVISIEGHNGVGKTSILESITWALYGNKAARNSPINESHKSSKVTVNFAVDGESFAVTRTMRRTKSGSSSSVAITDSGGELLYPHLSKRELDSKIISIVGLDESSFYSILMMKQNAGSAFISASAKDRRNILSDMYPELTKWSYYNRLIDNDRKEVARDLRSCSSIIENIESSIDRVESKKDSILMDWPVHPSIVVEGGDNESYDEKILAARELELIDSIEPAVESHKKELRLALSKKTALSQLSARASSIDGTLDRMGVVTGYLDQIHETLSSEDRAVMKSLDLPEEDECYTCHQEISPTVRKALEAKQSDYEKLVQERNGFHALISNNYRIPERAANRAVQSLKTINKTLEEVSSEANSLGAKIVELNNKLSKMPSREKLVALAASKEDSDTGGLSKSNAIKALAALADCESILNSNAEELTKQKAELESLTARLEILKRAKAVTDESGIPKIISNDLIQRLNEYHQIIIDSHFGGPGIEVSYESSEADGDNQLDVMVSIEGSEKRAIEVVSGGERAVISLSGFFAFAKLMNDIRPGSARTLFFDEPFINLDAENLNRAMAGVYSYANSSSGVETVVLISHSDNATSMSDKVVSLVTGPTGNTEMEK